METPSHAREGCEFKSMEWSHCHGLGRGGLKVEEDAWLVGVEEVAADHHES